MEALKTKDIGTGLHFRAAHTQNIIANASLPFRSQILNGTARICSLPLFPDMTEADTQRVITALREIAGQ